ncbi:MAG: PKD domain-containing protein [Cyclobacteriaceae bacterium]
MKNELKSLKLLTLFFAVFSLGVLISCTEDDPDPKTEEPVASFQFEVEASDWSTINFTNFSQNASSYSWDFGDGTGTSTEESPSYTYAEGGTYTVSLTASNEDGESSTKTESVVVTDPLAAQRTLIGETGKTWQLVADNSTGAVAYYVGPTATREVWWAFGNPGYEEFCVRECAMDDTWTFNTDGTFTFDNNGDAWADGAFKEDVNAGCFDATIADNWIGANGEDLNGWNSGTHAFTYDPSASKLTVTGGFIGIPKATNSGELSTPASSISYDVVKIVDADVDTLVIEVVFLTGDGTEAFWQSTLVSYDNEADKVFTDECAAVEAVNVTFKVNMNDYDAAFTQMYVSGSFNGWSGDGWPMDDTDADGVWELTKEVEVGEHEYKFTIDNWAAQEEFTEGVECTVTKDGFTNRYLNVESSDLTVGPYCFNSCADCPVTIVAADLQGKTWHLVNGPGAVRVGPGIGAGDWFTNDQAWADAGPCLFDDTFVFNADGSFVIDVKDEMFTESHMEGIDANGCVAVGSVPANLTAWTGGTFTHAFTAATDTEPAKVTVTGNGAYIGFYKGANGSEPNEPQDGSITYEIISFTGSSMEVSVDISGGQDRSAAWTMKLVTD